MFQFSAFISLFLFHSLHFPFSLYHSVSFTFLLCTSILLKWKSQYETRWRQNQFTVKPICTKKEMDGCVRALERTFVHLKLMHTNKQPNKKAWTQKLHSIHSRKQKAFQYAVVRSNDGFLLAFCMCVVNLYGMMLVWIDTLTSAEVDGQYSPMCMALIREWYSHIIWSWLFKCFIITLEKHIPTYIHKWTQMLIYNGRWLIVCISQPNQLPNCDRLLYTSST